MQQSPAHRPRRRTERPALSRARRRRRLVIPIAVVAALVAIVVLNTRISSGPAAGGGNAAGLGRQPSPVRTTLVVRKARTPLPAPISGESAVVVPGGLLILGGLDSSGVSVSGAFLMDTASGRLRGIGSLSGPLHDAAATSVSGRVLVFGGGTATSTAIVQALPAQRVPGAIAARAVGRLPSVRSDLSAVTLGASAYVLGGYDGSNPDASVLKTFDGSRFSRVANLQVAARYMAAVPLDGKVYGFGGETASGGSTDAIQEVDPSRHAARVIGRLPQPISHASAVVLGDSAYILGGEVNGTPSDQIWRFDPGSGNVAVAGRLPITVADGASATIGGIAYLIGGTGARGDALRTIVTVRLRHGAPAAPVLHAQPAPDRAPTAPSPFSGRLLIADRGNNRLIVVNGAKRVVWRYPSQAHPAPPGGFYFPDDAFFTHGGAGIISNEEQNERIVQLGFPSGRLRWSYGHPGTAGSEPGYLHEPDDAYLLNDGTISVADAQNCRVLLISPAKRVLNQIGSNGSCLHDPPRYLGSPNGDTPLPNGDILVSEVNGSYIDEIARTGKVRWSVQLPIAYPSDPQQLGPDRYLVADYTSPGGIYEFDRKGKILWSYHPSSGHGMLNHPSLAEQLPDGLIVANDDYRERVVIIDPRTKRIVWQYGHTDSPGRGPDRLHTPDGFDLLAPDGTTPTHPRTG